ncbi:hypothetical protein niasHT_029990 [Heterodera trifolii]|uniref:Carbonic anhydrase n=1 Tax=Heterodera trifolii TaxID=157864 RepID=A0ABD2JJH5_9BILA
MSEQADDKSKRQSETGDRQSPIDISSDWFIDNDTPAIHFANYDKRGTVTMRNDGHTVIVGGFENWDAQPCISKGGFGSAYTLRQFHFHWSLGQNGSEHTIDGRHYTAELHLVHVKEGLSLADALAMPDGIAVLGVLLQSTHDGSALLKLQTGLSQVTKKGASFKIDNFLPNDLLPSGLNSFFRYYGSLTTPDYNEAVIWTVFAAPRSISEEQIQLFRAVCGDNGNPIKSNVRPVQKYNKKAQKQAYEKIYDLP